MTLPTLSSLTPEQIRVMIAEACGWVREPNYDGETWPLLAYRSASKRTVVSSEYLPDYLSDLNAMAEAEKVLTRDQWRFYIRRLRSECIHPLWRELLNTESEYAAVIVATATQRAHAFLIAGGREGYIMNAIEEWRPVSGFEGYEVSDLGNIEQHRPQGGVFERSETAFSPPNDCRSIHWSDPGWNGRGAS